MRLKRCLEDAAPEKAPATMQVLFCLCATQQKDDSRTGVFFRAMAAARQSAIMNSSH
jgi:hypothetical protein